ncbi:low-density lipoprotein receptor-related protein 4-like isoform X2 [Haliotis rufescens]|uniref:low-density lipoprotein receptor-related protein 4-like isoform X2 n=1 Tax=Haliotis rufescens TaxID=6454 RepID=UPI00201FAAAF|nr:low-density lipoprotein receptor-related protein 4-like isoform X2 [Haliotis rufescens]
MSDIKPWFDATLKQSRAMILQYMIVVCGLLPWIATGQAESPQLVVLLTDLGKTGELGFLHKINLHDWDTGALNIANMLRPTAIDVDRTRHHVYWTDVRTYQIRRADLDGGNNQLMASLNTSSNPEGITLDSQTRQVFYTDAGADIVARIEMDSLQSTVIVSTGLDKPMGIVADTNYKKLYWVNRGNSPKIETSDYNGAARATLVSSGLAQPNGITIDQKGGRLFWTDSAGYIESMFTNGTQRKRLRSESGRLFFYISHFNGFLYYTVRKERSFFQLHEDGLYMNIKLTASGVYLPLGIHVYSPNVNATELATCPDGRYGPACTECGQCSKGEICEKTIGQCFVGCAAGYKPRTCSQECDPGFFGENCKSPCSKCRTGTSCDHVTGKCPDGCQTGWEGDLCNVESESGHEGGLSMGTSFLTTGLIIGIAAGGALVVVIVVVVVAVCVVKKRRRPKVKEEGEVYTDIGPLDKTLDENAYTPLGASRPTNPYAEIYTVPEQCAQYTNPSW